MARTSRHREYNEELNVWQASTDLMSSAFLMLILFLLLTIITSSLSQTNQNTDTPPIILIQDEGAYRFASGSAEIPPKMLTYILREIIPNIESNAKKYNIDVVEVIGHTDGQPNGNVVSNLDQNLEKVVNGELPIVNLRAGSNADLGLMRALAVVKVLRDVQRKQGKLAKLSFRGYSAAQMILPSGKIAAIARQDDKTRRRIEIRFTRLGKEQEVK
ncbi:flagellar motor protein [Anabaena subtropica]|uniref:Flagellar motor protein n=1 Tax=Anabaena subtropica FACHB-260 TaxID=2692884 RepID=A0ABR8CY97_9NOST|nr:flagellar motor protein [Anabaena subtropica]MBD2346770.1 flagellar motor protein [Anabaena subtropica FACHB-260]